MKLCSLDWCSREYYAKGLCNGHWAQVYRLGWSEPRPFRGWGRGHPRSEPVENRGCQFQGCDKPHNAKGWCAGHYKQVSDGRPMVPLRQSNPCDVQGCKRSTQVGTLCRAHKREAKLYHYDPVWLQQLRNAAVVCEACHGPFDGPHGSPVVDHDHETGEIRGIICNSCNLIDGMAKGDAQRLRALAEYLEGKHE